MTWPARLALAFALMLALLWPPASASASWRAMFDSAMGRAATPATLSRVIAHIQALDPQAGAMALAADAGAEGHWRLVNRAGEAYTAATPDELVQGIAALLPAQPAAAARRPIAFYLTDTTVFRRPEAIAALPASVVLHLVTSDAVFTLARGRGAGGPRLMADIGPRLLADVADEAAFREVLAQLARPLTRERLRVLSLEPGATTALTAAARMDPATGRAFVEAVDPDALRHVLPVLAGQTVILVGRLDGERLVVRPGSGPERSLLAADLTAAAARADVDLLILRTPTADQPGTRNWLWLKSEVAGLAAAVDAGTLGQLLAALTPPDDRLVVAAARTGARTHLRAAPAATLGRDLNPFAGLLTDLISQVTGTAAIQAVDAHLVATSRRQDLALRLLPGIPAWLQFGYLAAVLPGLAGLSVARAWWGRLWPPEARAEYGSRAAYAAARLTRVAAFAMLFLPLAGLPALLARLAALACPTGRRPPA